MLIIGSDFTSDPRPGKPITAASCRADENKLVVQKIEQLVNFQSFALVLCSQQAWVAGVDFPFGQPQKLIDDLDWKRDWSGYVTDVAAMGKRGFRTMLNSYRKDQPQGKKEHFRVADRKAKSISPMKLYGVPVGVMFCEGAPFLLASPASILPFLPDRDSDRIVVEAYPKLVATKVIGTISYKTDDVKKVTAGQRTARKRIVEAICNQKESSIIRRWYGFHVECDDATAAASVNDPSGDTLDALLCALQAAWAWSKRGEGFGIPANVNLLEGWITDPEMLND